MKNISIKIYGDLKEAGIRFSAMHKAYKLGLCGLTMFLPDNSVLIEAEGKTEQIEKLRKWCLETAEKYDCEKTEIMFGKKLAGFSEFNIID